MPFWSRKKKQPSVKQQQQNASTVVIMESNLLGMTVIEEDNTQSDIQELEVSEWVDIIGSKKLDGFPYERILFSFLKGIPTFLRLKIWVLLCSQNNARNFRYTSKSDNPRRSSYQSVDELTVEVYKTLCSKEPMDKESQQIEKDIKRSFSQAKTKYRYLNHLLRKMLHASSNSGIEYTQGMNYILLNIIIFGLESIGVNESNYEALEPNYERDIFLVYRETIIRMDEVFGNNNIFKVIKELEEGIAEACPDILYIIYKYGLDCFSAFSQNYFSVMSYSDPPQDLSKLMLDLFFLIGEKAIHGTIIKMLSITQEHIARLEDPEQLQKFLKNDIYFAYYKSFIEERMKAKNIEDFGLCFFDRVERMKM